MMTLAPLLAMGIVPKVPPIASRMPKTSGLVYWSSVSRSDSEASFDVQRLRLVVARMRIVASEEELVTLMARIDSDNDGVISFSEFVEFVTHEGDETEGSLVGRLRSAFLHQKDLKVEFDALSRVQHEARIIDGGTRYASTYDAKDWMRVLLSWPSSFVVKRIRSPLIFISLWAFFVALAHRISLDLWFAAMAGLGAAAPGVGVARTMTIAGSALSLLLVFRTNTAYNRYFEGRKVWEQMSSAARDCADFSAAYVEEMGTSRLRRIADLLCAFPLALQLYLQGQPLPLAPCHAVEADVIRLLDSAAKGHHTIDGEPAVPLDCFVEACRANEHLAAAFSLPSDVDANVALQQLHVLKFGTMRERDRALSLAELKAYYNPLAIARLLPADVRARLARSRCPPLEICRQLVREAKAIPYDEPYFSSRERINIINTIAKLRSCIGFAERIAQTPVPLHYARHALRFLSLFCIALPFAIVDQLGFLVVPATAFLVWALYGLREIGTLIENPFSRPLPLQIISETLYIDVREATDAALHNHDDVHARVDAQHVSSTVPHEDHNLSYHRNRSWSLTSSSLPYAPAAS